MTAGADIGREETRWEQTLPALLDPAEARRLLALAAAERGWSVEEVLAAELIKGRPERRRTLRYRVVARKHAGLAGAHTWYAKQYRGSKGERVARVLRALREHGIAAPELIGYSAKRKLLVMGALEGRTLTQDLTSASRTEVAADLEHVRRAVASLHAIPCGGIGLPRHGWEEEARVLIDAGARIRGSTLPPKLVLEWDRASWTVRSGLAPTVGGPEAGPPPVPALLHRDLHPGQIVLGEEHVGFLDWDEAAYGDPELDLGNLQAHLILASMQREKALESLDAVDRLGRGAGAGNLAGDARRSVYTASALLRLASLERLALSTRSGVDWPDLAHALLEAALHHVSAA